MDNQAEKILEKQEKKEKARVLKGFFDFLKQYSVIGLAIGLVIGEQSQNLVKTIVSGIITPFLGLFLPNSDSLRELTVHISILSKQDFHIGQVIQSLLEFVIILFIIYFVIKILLKRDDLIDEKKK
jgi:large conductance mechanosensitive channel